VGYFIHGFGRESGRPRAGNRGASDRVPLVIDAAVNDWVAALLERAAGATGGRAHAGGPGIHSPGRWLWISGAPASGTPE